jgi:hypothetical protein
VMILGIVIHRGRNRGETTGHALVVEAVELGVRAARAAVVVVKAARAGVAGVRAARAAVGDNDVSGATCSAAAEVRGASCARQPSTPTSPPAAAATTTASATALFLITTCSRVCIGDLASVGQTRRYSERVGYGPEPKSVPPPG